MHLLTTRRGNSTFSLHSPQVLGWAMYDFANTIFSFAVITLYFNEWIVKDRHNPDWYIGAMALTVSAALIITLPGIGAIADRIGRRMPFLAIFTAGCIALTAILGTVHSTTAALVIGGLAIFCYQSALAHYDPLLGTVAPDEHRGTVSGLGVGLGYAGVIVGSLILNAIVGEGDKQHAFLPTAILFAAFSIPTFLFVRDARPPEHGRQRPPMSNVIADASRQLGITARHIRSDHRNVARFLIGRFLYVDAIATVITFMTIYMERLGGFSAADKQHVLAFAMIAAAVGALTCGRVVERRGPRSVLLGILAIATCTLVAGALVSRPGFIWVLAPLIGLTLGGVWTSDRVFMMRLSPPAARGEFFAIYGLIGRLSNGFGPLVLWGGSLWLLHQRAGWSELAASRAALLLLAGATLTGALIIRGVDDRHRRWDTDTIEAELS